MQKKYYLSNLISVDDSTSVLNLTTDLSNIKVTNAVLKFYTISGSGTVTVSYYLNDTTNWTNVDRIQVVDGTTTYKLNITDELQEIINNNQSTAEFKFILTEGNCSFLSNMELTVEYCDIEEYKLNSGYQSFDLKDAGKLNICLATRDLHLNRHLTTLKSGGLKFDLSQNYNSIKHPVKDILNLHNGEKWSLSCQQYLISVDELFDDGKKGSKFKYVDGNGKIQTVEERYYYIENNDKIYVDKEKVEVDMSGNRVYNVGTYENPEYRDILISQESTTGLKLVSSIEDIKGAKLIDYEPEELIQLKKQIEQLTDSIEDLQYNIDTNNIQLCLYALSKHTLEKQHKLQKNNSVDLLDSSNMQKYFELMDFSEPALPTGNATLDEYLKNGITVKVIEDVYKYIKDKTPITVSELNSQLTETDINSIKNYLTTNANMLLKLGLKLDAESNGSIYQQIQNYQLNKEIYKDEIMYDDFCDIIKNIESLYNEEEIGSLDYDAMFSYFLNNIKNHLTATDDSDNNEDNTGGNIGGGPTIMPCSTIINTVHSYPTSNPPTDVKLTLSEKDILSLDFQIHNLLRLNVKYKKEKLEYEEQLSKYNHQKDIYEMQVPVHYLYDENGMIFGFGKTKLIATETNYSNDGVQVFSGDDTYSSLPTESVPNDESFTKIFRLIYIADMNDNHFFISYDSLDENKIKRIESSDKKYVEFHYNENELIESIFDTNENETSLVYNNNLQLEKVITKNKIVRYYYDDNDNLINIINSSGLGCHITYIGNMVEKCVELSVIENIVDGKINYKTVDFVNFNANSYLLNDKAITFVNDDYKSTTIIDSKGNKITYNFDRYGNVITKYKNALDLDNDTKCVEVMTYSYKNDRVCEVVKNLPYSTNYLSNECFHTEETSAIYMSDVTFPNVSLVPYDYTRCGVFHTLHENLENNIASITLTNLSQSSINSENILILSGWAKADSAFILTEYDNEDEYPEYIRNRKFEIRADVLYSDGSSKTFKKQFDWMNLNWQYCALPIHLDNKTIETINCVFDYSNNTNSVDFTDFVLTSGIYEKSNYNDEKLIISKENSNSKWVTYYYYDKNRKLINEVIFDKNNETLNLEYNQEINQFNTLSEFIKNKIDTNSEVDYLYVIKYEYNKVGNILKYTDYNGIVNENVYDDNGVVIKSFTYHKDEPTNKLYKENKMDDKGNIIGELNELGEDVSTLHYNEKAELVETKDKNGCKTTCSYNSEGNLLEKSCTIDGENNANTFIFRGSYLTKCSHNGFEISYGYDSYGRNNNIQIAGKNYLNKTFQENQEIVTLGNGDSIITTYDQNGQLLDTYYNDNLETRNFYDTYGNLVQTTENPNSQDQSIIHSYNYNKFGKIEDEIHQSYSIHNSYDSNQNIDRITFNYNNKVKTYSFNRANNIDATLETIDLPSNNTQMIKYDKLNRISEISFNNNLRQYHYLKNGDHTSNLISSVWFGDNNSIKENLKYVYDEKGNITEIKENGNLIAKYSYDGMARLVREDNKVLRFTSTFEYDAGGNLVRKKVYNFSLKPIDEITEIDNICYEYSSNGWRDQLLAYNGNKIEEYDNLGNPHKYQGKSLDWSHGRHLIKFGDVSFSYNSKGIRTSKTINEKTTSYIVHDNKVISSINDTEILDFGYGVDGLAEFTIFKNDIEKNYTYKKNIQGDIIGIYEKSNNSEDNNLIVKYVYDAWGKHSTFILKSNGEYLDLSNEEEYNVLSGDEKILVDNRIDISALNPFRYRGYYYDIETKLYYLNTRYYDPETGRFINADDISVLPHLSQELNGLNLYAYCFNNPVNDIDENGCWSWKKVFGWIAVAVVAVAAVAAIVVGTVVTGGLLGAVLVGAGVGALVAMGTSIYAQGGFSEASPWSVAGDGLIGAAIGAASGAVSYGLGVVGQEVGKSIGMIFANTPHISSGITFGKIFGTGFMMSVGSFIGKVIGGLIGGTASNYFVNLLQGNNLTTEETLNQGVTGEIPGWILDTFKWLLT